MTFYHLFLLDFDKHVEERSNFCETNDVHRNYTKTTHQVEDYQTERILRHLRGRGYRERLAATAVVVRSTLQKL
jgi:hypothetical protein